MKHRLLLCFLFALVPCLFAARDRVTQPVDRTRTIALRGHVHPKAQPQFDDGALDPATPLEQVTLFFQPAPGIDTFLAGLQTPSSPDYRHFLTPPQFADRFGLSTSDLAKVSSWLQSQGLQIEESGQGRHWIRFNGAAGQMAKALRTEFRRYRVNGESHFANSIAPSVPAAFAGIIAGFDGLDDFKLRSFVSGPRPLGSLTNGSHYLVPDDFATIYNVAPLYAAGVDGSGQNIAIVGTSAIDVTDVRTFRRTYNLPASDPQMIPVGRDPGITSSFIEAYLDIEWAGAVARNAKIIYVYASSAFTAAAYAVDQNVAPVLSMSFGNCELYLSPIFRGVAQQANAQGITFLVASGDAGAATCDLSSPTPQASKGALVAFPASLPEVTAVGGTSFDEGSGRYWNTSNNANGASAIGYIPETVWNDAVARNSLSGAGGGASALFAKPWWQNASGVPDDKARDIPDVSFTASLGHDPYRVYALGTIYAVGGTSAPTPAFAGVVALLNQSLTAKNIIAQPGLGNINPTLYRLARTTSDVFHDITTGNNAVPCVQGSPGCVEGAVGFNASPGYDLATGLGSVDVSRMIAQWGLGAASTTNVSVDPSPVSMGATVKLTATVKGSTIASPTGIVTFVAQNGGDSVLGSAPLASSGNTADATLEVPARVLLASSGTVTALYTGDSSYEASAGTVKIESAAPSGSHVVAYVAPGTLTPISPTGAFPIVLVLYEKTGVATTLTAFSIDGSPQSVSSIFASAAIPANGSISFSGTYNPGAPIANSVFHFAGRDADGSTWSEDVSVQYADSTVTRLAPGITVTSSAASVAQDPAADPTCRWSHLLTIRETGGFLTQLDTLRQGSTSLNANIQQIFGTTRLAPFGVLSGIVCLDSSAVGGTRLYTVSGVSEVGNTVTATASVAFAGPVAAPAKLSSASPSIAITDGSPATFRIAFDTGSPAWTAVLPAKPGWLTVGNPSGSGSASITLQPNAGGLSKGAYTTMLWIQCAGCLPQTLQVPVTLVIGNSTEMTLAGVAHGASFKTAFAPGMVLSAFGTQLAPGTVVAADLPLPLTLSGVSATINGITAPLYFISPGQLNVQVPYEVGIGPAVLAVNNNGKIATFLFQVAMVAPGLFANDGFLAYNPSGSQGQTLLAFITGDGDLTPTLATGATPAATTVVSRLPRPRQTVTMTVGGVPATIAFIGVPSGLSGVTQINFTVPPDAPLGDQPVVVTVGGVDSPVVKLTVKASN